MPGRGACIVLFYFAGRKEERLSTDAISRLVWMTRAAIGFGADPIGGAGARRGRSTGAWDSAWEVAGTGGAGVSGAGSEGELGVCVRASTLEGSGIEGFLVGARADGLVGPEVASVGPTDVRVLSLDEGDSVGTI